MWGESGVYYKILLLWLLNINYIQEGIIFALSIKNKLCIIVALYRFPSQSHSEFTNFVTSLELTLQAIASKNPYLSLALGHFNTKNKAWFDQDNTATEGTIINDLTTQYGLNQIIHEPTHLLDWSSSCINLIFTSQDNLVTNSAVHSSFHSNCHHQNFFSKFNLKIYYPPPHERDVCEYDKINKDLIKKASDAFDWDKKLSRNVLMTKCHYLMKIFWISWAILYQRSRWSLMTRSLRGLIEKSKAW